MGNPNNKFLWIPTPLYLSFLLHHLTNTASGESASLYTPSDNIVINCGSSSSNSTALDGRTWIGDVNSKFFPLEQSQNKASLTKSTLQQSSYAAQVPYATARLSVFEFTYIFPVNAGQKFIRLYFYPASYPNSDRSEALFSVKAGPFTLLSDFNASLTADADTDSKGTIFREFCVNVEENQTLNISFIPSKNAYAFINGLEVVSMPTNLYYTPAEDPLGLRFLTQQQPFRVENTTALETVYRVNVGGAILSSTQDTGMFRNWRDKEEKYLTVFNESVIPVNMSIELSFTKQTPPYTAPEDVYRTARTMGTTKEKTKSYNLTWEFPVDSRFYYLVRLHFCEFQSEIIQIRDRVFLIFIANQTAEKAADVMRWTGGKKGVPFHRDYAVSMFGKESEKQVKLSIALQANPDDRMTSYNDAILNGIEIFKISINYSLAGPNPDPLPTTPPTVVPRPRQSPEKKNNTATVIAVVGGVLSGLLVFSILGFSITRHGGRVKDSGPSDKTSWWGPFSFSTIKSTKNRSSTLPSWAGTGFLVLLSKCKCWCWRWPDPYRGKSARKASSLPEKLCRHFSLPEIKTATNNFQEELVIGVGGFGNVYKGYIDEGTMPVAIKRLNPESRQGAREFRTEIELLSQLRHVHLVSLIGYCNGEGEMILVYGYMTNGTLRDHLYDTENNPIPWKKRLKICIGAACGLNYLHTGLKNTIIHRDVKTTNILLDDKCVAKISDFGLSKTGLNNNAVSTMVKGTFGYLDPEYAKRQQLTDKSDVYSFGVVLFEVLCARKALNHNLEHDQRNLAIWAKKCIHKGIISDIIDPYLMGKIAPECFKVFVEIAESCVREQGILRLSMNDVMEKLDFALKLQEDADAENEIINPGGEPKYQEVSSFHFPTTTGGHMELDSGVPLTVTSMNSELTSLDSGKDFIDTSVSKA